MKFIVALLLLSSFAIAGEAPPATAPSNTRFASRDLRIKWGDMQPPEGATEAFFNSVPIELGSQVLGIPAEKVSEAFRYSFQWNGVYSEIIMAVTVPPDAKFQAKEFLDQLTVAIQKWAQEQVNLQRASGLRAPAQARDEAEMRLAQATDGVRKDRATIAELAGRADVTPGTITSALTKLEDEKQKLELDQMAKHARAEALEKQLSVQAEKIQAQVDADPIVAELQKVVEARDKRMEQVKQQAAKGLASQAEVSDAVANAAEARAKLLQRKRDAAAEAGGAALEGLNRELLLLAVDLRELEARLEFVQKHLPGLREAMQRLDSLERAESDLIRAKNELDKADAQLRAQARALNATTTPSMIIAKSQNLAQPPPEKGLFGGKRD